MMNHFYQDIGGYCTFPAFYAYLAGQVPERGARIVELGCAYGQSAACLAVELINQGRSDAKVNLVDTGPQSNVEANLRPVAHIIGAYHQMDSVAAASLYAHGSLDAVFIDADHSQSKVMQDIAAWRVKVKSGGILAGHDFTTEPGVGGVIEAVTESFDHWSVWRCSKFTNGKYYPVWWVRIGENGSEASF